MTTESPENNEPGPLLGLGLSEGLGAPAVKLPAWMRGLPAHTELGTVEICQVFGLHRNSITRALANGSVPAPYRTVKKMGRETYRWRLGDIRKLLASAPNVRANLDPTA